MSPARGEGDHEGVLVHPAQSRDRVLARAGDDFGADVEQGEQMAQIAGEERHLIDPDDHHALRGPEGRNARFDLLAGQVARRVLDVSVVGGERGLELGMVEIE